MYLLKARIYVDQAADPKCIKTRAAPYALRTNVELELERLELEGIISPVEFSEWAAPIVPVAKPSGTVRICGDCKLTINNVSKLDNYPAIPKTKHLLATLGRLWEVLRNLPSWTRRKHISRRL